MKYIVNIVRNLSNEKMYISSYTAHKRKFSIKEFCIKCHQIRSFLRTWSYLLKRFLMENFIFCAVQLEKANLFRWVLFHEVTFVDKFSTKIAAFYKLASTFSLFCSIDQNSWENPAKVLIFEKLAAFNLNFVKNLELC